MKFAALLLTAACALTAAEVKTFTGIVEDDMCGGDHKKMAGTDPVKCTEDCVKGMGAKYALISGKDVYVLSNQAAASKFINKQVKVTGTLIVDKKNKADAKVIEIKTIEPAK